MKIAHISTSKTGGAGIAAYRIHQGLMMYGGNIESNFVQKTLPPNPDNHFYRCTHYHNLYYRVVNKLGLKPYLTEEGRYERIVSKYPKDYEIVSYPVSYFPIEEHPIVKEADIIHLHWVSNFLNYPSFFSKVKQPIVWTLHDMNPFLGLFHYEEDERRNLDTLGNLNKKVIQKKYDYIHQKENLHIVSPSNWLKTKSENSPNLKGFPHYLIPYGMEIANFPSLDKKESKIKLNIGNNRKNILFIANHIGIYRKGMDMLLEALNGLDPSLFNLIVIGYKHSSLNIDKKINYIELDHIKDITELNTVYSAADITIMPSREDNLPNTMLESLINGTPVISFSNGGMAEHIRTGENGILVNETNSKALRNAINEFLSGKYVFNRDTIRKYPVQHLSSRLQADRYIDLYKEILNKK